MKNPLMLKVSLLAALLALVTLGGRSAIAGYRYGTEVVIDKTSMMAKGSMAQARASADSVQQIGCSLRAQAGAKPYAWCHATNSAGEEAECTSYDPGIVQIAGTINASSTLYFTWNASKVCTGLYVDNFSSNAPPQP